MEWWKDAVFYHIYPLGCLEAPARNDFQSEPVPRIRRITEFIPHIKALGCSALYLGPVFESSGHGYDTAEYTLLDRRLGTFDDLKYLVENLHAEGIRLVLDGVFNHVGRDFWAFRDVIEKREDSSYKGWFKNIDFRGNTPCNDGFSYEAWEGHYELVSLNLMNPEVRKHLLSVMCRLIEEVHIDGIRLDVAYLLEREFLRELSAYARELRSDFWLLGEMIHGDYRELVQDGLCHSATNYECFKGLYSSHNDGNYFEIAWSLGRQFGRDGIYRGLDLYNFADNHDVNRAASLLHNPRHLYPLYTILFTMPGIPSIYYGSEWGIPGGKNDNDDRPVRPSWNEIRRIDSSLPGHIALLTRLRWEHKALRFGGYRQLYLDHRQLVFARDFEKEMIVTAVNSDSRDVWIPNESEAELTNVFDDREKIRPGDRFLLFPFGWKIFRTGGRN